MSFFPASDVSRDTPHTHTHINRGDSRTKKLMEM